MQIYSHILDLRIWHPSLNPQEVTATLGIEPNISWCDGEPRKTRNGTILQGIRNGGYWSSNPFSYGWQSSADMQLEDALEELITFIEPHSAFLKKISGEGVIRIWSSTQSERNYALDLTPNILARVAALGIYFVHDVYQGAH